MPQPANLKVARSVDKRSVIFPEQDTTLSRCFDLEQTLTGKETSHPSLRWCLLPGHVRTWPFKPGSQFRIGRALLGRRTSGRVTPGPETRADSETYLPTKDEVSFVLFNHLIEKEGVLLLFPGPGSRGRAPGARLTYFIFRPGTVPLTF